LDYWICINMQMPLYVLLVLVSVAASLDPNIGQSVLKVLNSKE